MIRFLGVGFEYAHRTPWAHWALRDVDLGIVPREHILVMGPNGSGKSTFAWLLADLIKPTVGKIESYMDVTIAFQHSRLQLFRPTVGEDVGFGAEDIDVDESLERVALDPSVYKPKRIDDLSGGEMRRVALAGLLARKPDLLVLDEPLAGLDVQARATLVRVLTELQEESIIATVIVSHDLEDLGPLANRAIWLEEGHVIADGPAERLIAEAM